MRTLILALLALFLFCQAAPAAPAASAQQLSPRQILDRVDDLFRGKSCLGRMTMRITTANYQRELSLKFWTEGKSKSLFRIQEPQKEKGTATLRVGKDVWNYLPKVRRVIKLPSSMMSASWMGSHFSNDDLVKESRMAEDYTFEVAGRKEQDGQPLVEIDCRPRPQAAVVWGKVLVEVWEKRYLPRRIRYYDEDLKLARTMVFGQVRDFGERRLPALVTITPADKPNEHTEVIYHELEFNREIPATVFSIRNLTR